MRNDYKELVVQVIEFTADDVITTSGIGETVRADRLWDENPWEDAQ